MAIFNSVLYVYQRLPQLLSMATKAPRPQGRPGRPRHLLLGQLPSQLCLLLAKVRLLKTESDCVANIWRRDMIDHCVMEKSW